MDAASRQRRLSLRGVQTHCGIKGGFGNHDEGGERLVGLGEGGLGEGGRRDKKVKPPRDNER
jgi:hypothetical protein